MIGARLLAGVAGAGVLVAVVCGCAGVPATDIPAATSGRPAASVAPAVELSEQLAERLSDCTDGVPVYVDTLTGALYGDQDHSGRIELQECADK